MAAPPKPPALWVAGGAVRRRSAPPVAAWPLALAAKEPSRAAKVQGSGRLLSYFGHRNYS